MIFGLRATGGEEREWNAGMITCKPPRPAIAAKEESERGIIEGPTVSL